MARKNHHSLKYKMEAQPNKRYKDLKQKQKAKISDWMFREVCEYYRAHNEMPSANALSKLAKKVFSKIQGAAIWVPYEDFLAEFLSRQARFSERIEVQGLPAPHVPRQKKTEAEKLALKRAQRKNRKKKETARRLAEQTNPDQNDDFFFIAGYTSGGAPYGVTWDEMGLEPYESLFGAED